jgi:signal transduction histidine kinase
MSRMVEDLLFLVRTESAAPPFRMEPVEAQVLLSGLLRRAEALAAEHDATLDTTLRRPVSSGWTLCGWNRRSWPSWITR